MQLWVQEVCAVQSRMVGIPASSRVEICMVQNAGDRMNLIFVQPTYGPVDPQTNQSVRVAIMHASKYGHQWVGDASPDRLPFACARNKAVESVVNEDKFADASMFWCDSDIILPSDAITRLAETGKDFITGIYFQRGGDHRPLIANFNGKSFQWLAKWPPNVIAPVDGCGFGCVLTSVKMLRAIAAPWFEYLKYSEDFDFCLKAEKAGFQLYCDTGVLCGHLMDPMPATIETYFNKYSQFKVGVDENGCIRANSGA